MNDMRLEGIKACVFDAYGTLFDHASAAARCREELGSKLDGLNTLWREKQLQYTWLRTLEGKHADFWAVTGDALDFTLEMTEVSIPRQSRGVSQRTRVSIGEFTVKPQSVCTSSMPPSAVKERPSRFSNQHSETENRAGMVCSLIAER